MVRMGTRWETRDNAGISNLLQLMVVRGTTTLDGTQIVEAADRMGGSIEAYGDADYSEIAATALSRYWGEMLELVADVALRPTMPDGTVQAVRDFLVRQIRNRGDKPYDVALDTLLARDLRRPPLRLGSDRAQGEPRAAGPRGAPRPLPAPLRAGGHGAGGERQGEERPRCWPGPSASSARLPPAPGARPQRRRARRRPRRRARCCTVPGAQAQILMGGLAPVADRSRLSRDEGDEHGAGRRDGRALLLRAARQAGARLHDGRPGADARGARATSWPCSAPRPRTWPRRRPALREQLERIQREPVSDEELRVAKAYVLGSLAMDRRTNARQAWYLAGARGAGVGYEFLDRYAAQVRR